jgi:GTP-binding protein Era
MKEEYRSGFVAVVGRPNVGKSTLINYLARQKIAIVSEKPQTTRHQIKCIVTRPDAQIILIDTPGFHKPRSLLGEHLNRTVRNALSDSDAIIFMVDAFGGVGRGDQYLARELHRIKTPVILLVNKVDAISPEQLRKQLEEAQELNKFQAVIPISGLKGTGVGEALEEVVKLLPTGPQYYPEGEVTDLPESVIISEFVRERVLELTREEVPHSVAAEVEEISPREGKDLLDVQATVYVERESQKAILIGKDGRMLKQIGTRARRDIERLLGSHINLQLWVKVKKDWTRDEEALRRMGY